MFTRHSNLQMNRVLTFLVALAMSLPVFAIDENEVRAVDVRDFDALVVSLSAKIDYQCSTSPYLELSGATKKLLESVEVIEKDGVLSLGMKKGASLQNIRRIRVRVGSRKISRIDLPGAVNFRTHCPIRCEGDFSLAIAGAAEAEIAELEANEVTLKLGGAGSMKVTDVQCKSMKSTVSGAGGLDVYGLNCAGLLDASVNGVGGATFEGRSDEAKLKLNGAGVIDVTKLDCKNVRSSVNGIGSIKTAD